MAATSIEVNASKEETASEPETTSVRSITAEVDITTSKSICPPDFFGYIPHPTICESYYLCSFGVEVQLWCAPGFEFDHEENRCVRITGNGCTQTTSTESVTSTSVGVTTSEPETSSKPDTTSRPETTSIKTTTIETETTTSKPICPPDFFGYMPHPTICESYYLCSFGVEVQLWCAPGFEFDPDESVCVRISGNGCTQTTTSAAVTASTG